MAQVWYFVAVSYDPAAGIATLYQEAVINRYNSLLSKIVPFDYRSPRQPVAAGEAGRIRPDGAFLIGGATDRNPARGSFVGQCYSGKIDRCGVHGGALSRAELDAVRAGGPPPASGQLAYWDTTAGYTDHGIGDTVVDIGPYKLHAEGVNRPVRCQTGWNWNGRNDCFRLAPHEFGGVEFHNDALTDCRWEPTLSFTIPADLRSGVYADQADRRRRRGLARNTRRSSCAPPCPQGGVCLLMPTASYLAYANGPSRLRLRPRCSPSPPSRPVLQEVDIEDYKNDVEFGLSTYDLHNDGAGVCYSSYRRPIINMRPKYRTPASARRGSFPPTCRSSAGSST